MPDSSRLAALLPVVSVALGGALGSVARFAIGAMVPRSSGGFPYGTLAINVLGSFLLGFLLRHFMQSDAHPAVRLALTVGFCGGFTTFSTFSVETVRLMQSGHPTRATVYVVASVLLSVLATFAGLSAGRVIAD